MRTSGFAIVAFGIAATWMGCLGSYDDFVFGQASPSATAATGSGGAGSGGDSSGGAGAAAGGEGGAGASGGMGTGGGSGGAPPDATVACGGSPCDVSGGGYCCIPKTGGPTCETTGTMCTGNKATVFCDGPEDCPNQLCCATVDMGDLTVLQCASSCPSDHAIICDPNGPDQCEAPDTCQQSSQLGPDYHVCN